MIRGAGTILVGGGHPEHVGVEQEEKDQTDGHEVHVEAENYAAVVEAPATLHAADGVQCAQDGDQRGQDQQRSGAVVREVRERKRDCKTYKNEGAAA